MTNMTWTCWKMVVLLLTSGFFLGTKYTTFLWSDISWHSCSKSQDLPTNLRLYKISLFWQQGIWFHSIKWVIFSQICEIELQFSFILFQWNHSWDTSKNHEKVSRVCHGHLSSLSFIIILLVFSRWKFPLHMYTTSFAFHFLWQKFNPTLVVYWK
jgi:hypothetical protein